MARKPSLTPEQVRVIRSSDKTLKELGIDMGVSLLTVFKAKNGRVPYNYGDGRPEIREVTEHA
jgi:hypothetical protein